MEPNTLTIRDYGMSKVKFMLKILVKKNSVGSETGSGSGSGTIWKVGSGSYEYGYNAHVTEHVKRIFTFLASLLLASLSPISEMALLCGPEIKRKTREFFSLRIQHFKAI
jgi:hypothetical protein